MATSAIQLFELKKFWNCLLTFRGIATGIYLSVSMISMVSLSLLQPIVLHTFRLLGWHDVIISRQISRQISFEIQIHFTSYYIWATLAISYPVL